MKLNIACDVIITIYLFGYMSGIDARRIIAARHGMSLDEMRALRERLAGWLRTLTALKKDGGLEAAHCPPMPGLRSVGQYRHRDP